MARLHVVVERLFNMLVVRVVLERGGGGRNVQWPMVFKDSFLHRCGIGFDNRIMVTTVAIHGSPASGTTAIIVYVSRGS